MDSPSSGPDFTAEYEKYLRGCEYLGWSPVPVEAFHAKYRLYWTSRKKLDGINARVSRGLPWIRWVIFSETKRERERLARIERQLGHLHAAVEAGSSGGDGLTDSGVAAPLVIGPFSRSGAAKLELPTDFGDSPAA